MKPEIQVLKSSTLKGNVLFLPPKQLERNLYVRVKNILEGISGKWNKKAGGFVFRYDPRAILQKIIRSQLVIDFQKEYQIFETPEELAKKMIRLADIKPSDTILEPSAGRGAILDLIPKGPKIFACEMFSHNLSILKAKGYKVISQDFLTLPNKPRYTKIIANPPFTKGLDIMHIMKMYEVLQTGGRIVTLASPGWVFNQNKKAQAFRDFLDKVHAKVEYVDRDTFKESGTSIHTTLIVIDKKASYQVKPKRDWQAFMHAHNNKTQPKEEKLDLQAAWEDVKKSEEESARLSRELEQTLVKNNIVKPILEPGRDAIIDAKNPVYAFQLMKAKAELKVLSDLSLQQPLTDKQYARMMELKKLVFGDTA
jgi:hypothetical protein